MQAVILVGGRGERMRPLTDTTPKPMLLIKGKPILWYDIMLLKKHGITDIIMCGHYLFHVIKEYFGSGKDFGVNITYVDEPVPLGTAGAIKNAATHIKNDFVLLDGDIATNLDITNLVKFHKEKNALATLVLRKTDHPHDSDIAVIDENGRVIEFFKKPHGEVGNLGNTGLFAFSREILGHFSREGRLEHDVIAPMIKKIPVYGFVSGDYIRDIGTIERYEKVKKDLESISL